MQFLGFSPVVLALGITGGVFAMAANAITALMIRRLNSELSMDRQLSYFLWGTEIRRRYRENYQASNLTLPFDGCVLGMVGCFLVGGWLHLHSG